ncbi:MAG: hypothetical protein OEZ06_08370 [Myxococcales bacterium]|nr:hypothetical protein [Myxococcales bacterium]
MNKTLMWRAVVLLSITCGVGCSKVEDTSGDDEGTESSTSAISGGDGGASKGDDGAGQGSSDGSSDGGSSGSSSGSDEAGGSDGEATGDDSFFVDAGMYANVDGGIPCGATYCAPDACCADQFVSVCGAPIGERGCIMPPPADTSSDPRCPELNLMGFFTLPSCCTEDGMCGIDAANFGTGCIENARFAELASQMGGGGVDASVFPGPQMCDQ